MRFGGFIGAALALLAAGCDMGIVSTYTYVPRSRATEPVVPELDTRMDVPAFVPEPKPSLTPSRRRVFNLPPSPKALAVVPPMLVRGNPMVRRIALTFDDGPHEPYTDELIRILREFNVPATFFLIGRNVRAHPGLARKAKDAGIEIANHTLSHTRFCLLSEEEIRREIVAGADAIEAACGVRPRFFRPPGGEYDARTVKVAKELGMTMVLWTADGGDFTTHLGNPSPEAIMNKVLREVSPGGIVILHDPMPSTLKALPSMLTTLQALGFEFTTVSRLAADPMAVRAGGPRVQCSHRLSVQAVPQSGGYPPLNSRVDTHESPEQRTANEAATKGRADQGTDQGSKVGEIVEGQSQHGQGFEARRGQAGEEARGQGHR